MNGLDLLNPLRVRRPAVRRHSDCGVRVRASLRRLLLFLTAGVGEAGEFQGGRIEPGFAGAGGFAKDFQIGRRLPEIDLAREAGPVRAGGGRERLVSEVASLAAGAMIRAAMSVPASGCEAWAASRGIHDEQDGGRPLSTVVRFMGDARDT